MLQRLALREPCHRGGRRFVAERRRRACMGRPVTQVPERLAVPPLPAFHAERCMMERASPARWR